MKTTPVCGLQIACHTLLELKDELVARASQGKGGWIVTLNLEMVSRAARDGEYRRLLEAADVVIADGMPIVWASRKKHPEQPIPERTTGADLTRLLIQLPLRVSIIGGEDPAKALDHLGVPLGDRIQIYSGKVSASPDGVEDMAKLLALHDPQVVFLALGVPKQDILALQLRSRFPKALFLGVGGSFELISGQKPRAPGWMQAWGLEWLFRLTREPKRLWRRYLLLYPYGALALLKDLMSAKT